MKILELFSGTESFSNVARERGHEVFTVDIEPKFKPSLVRNIMNLDYREIPFKPDVIWASPPCNRFSVASIYHHWENGKPKHEGVYESLGWVGKTLQIIMQLHPTFWFIENPRGMLRKQRIMESLTKNTVTYCQYGHTSQKPTDIWNNCDKWIPKLMCKPGASCHERASRGSKKGIQGIYNKNDYMSKHRSAVLRAVVPKDLCLEIIKVCEKELGDEK